MQPTFLIPSGELALPPAPPGHTWSVKNLITTEGLVTDYSIEVRLYTEAGATAVTVAETWNRKRDSYTDFAVGIVGMVSVELYAYLAFTSIDWRRDNPEFTATKEATSSTETIEWVSPPGVDYPEVDNDSSSDETTSLTVEKS